jgi:hypothetical protein
MRSQRIRGGNYNVGFQPDRSGQAPVTEVDGCFLRGERWRSHNRHRQLVGGGVVDVSVVDAVVDVVANAIVDVLVVDTIEGSSEFEEQATSKLTTMITRTRLIGLIPVLPCSKTGCCTIGRRSSDQPTGEGPLRAVPMPPLHRLLKHPRHRRRDHGGAHRLCTGGFVVPGQEEPAADRLPTNPRPAE